MIGAVLYLTQAGLYLEEEFGLPLLFTLRGPQQPPENVVIVSIDNTSSEILHLPDDPEKWPRAYYAELIQKLNRQNPALIAFNLHFGEARDAKNDQRLALSMASQNNIILSNYLKQYSLASLDNQAFTYERIIDPITVLDHAALATAPFPLPKTASTVKQFWAYKQSAGGIPTFPVAIFQCFVLQQAFQEVKQLLDHIAPELASLLPATFRQLNGKSKVIEVLRKIKTRLENDPQAVQALAQLIKHKPYTPAKQQLLLAWLTLLQAQESLYLNHYGGADTITTIPFYQAIEMEILNPNLFRDKIVLVGYSESIEPEKNQGLYSVFTNAPGETISPIEIAATAVANLIDNNWIRSINLDQQFFLIFVWGLVVAGCYRFACYYLSVGLITLFLFSAAYLGFAYYRFCHDYLWLPVFIPLLIQSPCAFVAATISRFLQSKAEKRSLQKAFSFYLPNDVVNQVSNKADAESLLQFGELMQGVCMATDAGQYTTLAETMNALDINVLMNRYYGVMFPQVIQHHGIISDVVGDAMVALWAKPVADIQCRMNACQAALRIKSAVDRFNQSQTHPLVTRIGLHYGEMRLGNVGASSHYEYRAIGDTVNTATRIEGLNKVLGTQILLSNHVIENLSGFAIREMGVFILKGKTLPLVIYQLLEPTDNHWPHLVSRFTEALKQFQSHQWPEALASFQELNKCFPEDGPTQFYLRYLRQHYPFANEKPIASPIACIEIR